MFKMLVNIDISTKIDNCIILLCKKESKKHIKTTYYYSTYNNYSKQKITDYKI